MRTYRRLGVAVGLLAAAFVGAQAQAFFAADDPETAFVTTFNSGFTDAKRDDCDLGFADACHWLSLG
ncbi:hypothetical protein [Kitasatospora sp. NPDC059800]|uniref:hypothetical protein n=1 Tax=Kitasatospora sp. NPDC059800 TaxID=3346951 RepID=UPI00365631F9